MQKITDIHCTQCGAPASFDIVRQRYVCGYCGSEVGISEALAQKQGFRQLQKEKLKNDLKKYKLFRASCSGRGAELVFEENEALSNCAFCGRSLVRSEYLTGSDLPESVIPFRVTETEARDLLEKWCRENRGKKEAGQLSPLLGELKGFYLPYEMVRGPVHMKVSRMDRGATYSCEGFINDEFVNRSRQLDNLLLDGMEPYDLDGLTGFDPAYIAGHRVKTPDVPGSELEKRVREETSESYSPAVRKVLETKAVDVESDVSSAIRLPVLLPVYYVCKGDLMAAVNGQTGKVSVRSLKESRYYFLPWWLKALLATAAFALALFGALCWARMTPGGSLYITLFTTLVFGIVMLCYYSDTEHNDFSVAAGHKIYTSGEQSFTRRNGKLVLSDRILERKVVEPVFFAKIKDQLQPVRIRFTTPVRVIRMALLCLLALFLPVVIAVILTGFDFSRINLAGSAVWYCIAVPTVPVYLLKFGIVELYERPWIYIRNRKDKWVRYKKRPEFRVTWDLIKDILRVVFIPPASLAVWFGIISLIVMIYLTMGYD